jgi:hypothetical protein
MSPPPPPTLGSVALTRTLCTFLSFALPAVSILLMSPALVVSCKLLLHLVQTCIYSTTGKAAQGGDCASECDVRICLGQPSALLAVESYLAVCMCACGPGFATILRSVDLYRTKDTEEGLDGAVNDAWTVGWVFQWWHSAFSYSHSKELCCIFRQSHTAFSGVIILHFPH